MNLTEILQLLVLNELLILGIWTLFAKDMLLGEAGDIITSLIGEFWSKPVINCVPCMGSIYGTLMWFCTMGITLTNLFIWPSYVFALCGLGKLTMAFLDDKG